MQQIKNLAKGLLVAVYLLVATPYKVSAKEDGGSSGAGGSFSCSSYSNVFFRISELLLAFNEETLTSVDVNLTHSKIEGLALNLQCVPIDDSVKKVKNDKDPLKNILQSSYDFKSKKIKTNLNENLMNGIDIKQKFDLILYEFFKLLTINEPHQYVDSAEVIGFLFENSEEFNQLASEFKYNSKDIVADLIHRNQETTKIYEKTADNNNRECNEYINIVLKIAKNLEALVQKDFSYFPELNELQKMTLRPILNKEKIKNLRLRLNCTGVGDKFNGNQIKVMQRDLWSYSNPDKDIYETQIKTKAWSNPNKTINEHFKISLHETFVLLGLETDGDYKWSDLFFNKYFLKYKETFKRLLESNGIYKKMQSKNSNWTEIVIKDPMYYSDDEANSERNRLVPMGELYLNDKIFRDFDQDLSQKFCDHFIFKKSSIVERHLKRIDSQLRPIGVESYYGIGYLDPLKKDKCLSHDAAENSSCKVQIIKAINCAYYKEKSY